MGDDHPATCGADPAGQLVEGGQQRTEIRGVTCQQVPAPDPVRPGLPRLAGTVHGRQQRGTTRNFEITGRRPGRFRAVQPDQHGKHGMPVGACLELAVLAALAVRQVRMDHQRVAASQPAQHSSAGGRQRRDDEVQASVTPQRQCRLECLIQPAEHRAGGVGVVAELLAQIIGSDEQFQSARVNGQPVMAAEADSLIAQRSRPESPAAEQRVAEQGLRKIRWLGKHPSKLQRPDAAGQLHFRPVPRR